MNTSHEVRIKLQDLQSQSVLCNTRVTGMITMFNAASQIGDNKEMERLRMTIHEEMDKSLDILHSTNYYIALLNKLSLNGF